MCKKKVIRFALLALFSTVWGQTYAQNVFSPNVNMLRNSYQMRSANNTRGEALQQRGVFVLTCSADASTAAIANKIKELDGEINTLMGNMLVVSLPMSQLDAAAAIEGVLLIDAPKDGTKKTDTARKASHVDEAHQGQAAGMERLPQAYTGKGVIIGLIDQGFDFTHPMFKAQDGTTRIKGAYIVGDETYRSEGESLDEIPDVDKDGKPVSVRLYGSYFTDPKVILDTLKVKDTNGSHGTHCASIAAGSIMDYKDNFKGKDEGSGKLGGMAPDADIILANANVTKAQLEKYTGVDNLLLYNKLHALQALMHFADKQNKPLVVSWSVNNHEGFHDGTGTMARYIGAFCNPASQVPGSTQKGHVMALCSSNEGGEAMYIEKSISKGRSLKVLADQTSFIDNAAHFFIKTDKEIKVKLLITDKNKNTVYTCPFELSSKQPGYDSYFQTEVTYNPATDKREYKPSDPHYESVSEKLCDYLGLGSFTLFISEGAGLDKNNQQYTYVQISIHGEELYWQSEQGVQQYYPMLEISSPNADVKVQGWGDDYNLSTKSEDTEPFTPGTSDHSMGDWCTSGEAVVIGAYVTDRRNFYRDENTKQVKLEEKDDEIGKYAFFSSYGYDFSDARHAFPDVSAPGRCIYAAANSFASDDKLVTAEYSGQFEGQKEPRSYPYATMSGTSMSTPAAAGIIALWMQAAKDKNKTVDNKYIKEIIKATSDTDSYTKAEPLRYGAGKINAYKGLLYVLDLYNPTSINTISTHQPDQVTFRLDGNRLYTEGAADGTPVSLYNLQGVQVMQTTVQAGAISLDGLSKGVYAVQLGQLGSTLIRL